MRGHTSLLDARKNGYKADDVWFVYMPTEPNYTYTADPENLLQHGYRPEVHVYSTDNLMTADLRCIYGLNVHLINEFNDMMLLALKRFKPKAIYYSTGERYA